jgi:hypothetical protein
MADWVAWTALVVGVLALYPVAAFGVVSWKYRPRVRIQVGSNSEGQPSAVPAIFQAAVAIENIGRIPFDITGLRIVHDPSAIAIDVGGDGAQEAGSLDASLPGVMLLPWVLPTGIQHGHAFGWRQTAKQPTAITRVEARLIPHQEYVPGWCRIISAPSVLISREIEWIIVGEAPARTLEEISLRIGPGRTLAVHGIMAQQAMSAKAERGVVPVTVTVHEILRE